MATTTKARDEIAAIAQSLDILSARIADEVSHSLTHGQAERGGQLIDALSRMRSARGYVEDALK